MKRIVLFLLLPVSIWAQNPIQVVTSTTIFKDMIENIGGEEVAVHSIVPLGSDPHTYEAKPSDVTICQQADIIMINGLHLEVWIEKLIKNSKTKAAKYIITEGIDSIKGENYTDPHAWMDAVNGIQYAENICTAFIRFRPKSKDYFRKRTDDYVQKLKETHQTILQEISKIPDLQRVLVTNHDAFQYFGKRYGMTLVPLMGVSTEAEPKTSDIIKIIKAIKFTGVKAIFVESSVNPQLMAQVAQDMNISVGGSLYADSLGKKSSKGGTYIGMLLANTEMIVSALTQQSLAISTNFDTTQNIILYTIILIGLLAATLFFSNKILPRHDDISH